MGWVGGGRPDATPSGCSAIRGVSRLGLPAGREGTGTDLSAGGNCGGEVRWFHRDSGRRTRLNGRPRNSRRGKRGASVRRNRRARFARRRSFGVPRCLRGAVGGGARRGEGAVGRVALSRNAAQRRQAGARRVVRRRQSRRNRVFESADDRGCSKTIPVDDRSASPSSVG